MNFKCKFTIFASRRSNYIVKCKQISSSSLQLCEVTKLIRKISQINHKARWNLKKEIQKVTSQRMLNDKSRTRMNLWVEIRLRVRKMLHQWRNMTWLNQQGLRKSLLLHHFQCSIRLNLWVEIHLMYPKIAPLLLQNNEISIAGKMAPISPPILLQPIPPSVQGVKGKNLLDMTVPQSDASQSPSIFETESWNNSNAIFWADKDWNFQFLHRQIPQFHTS